MVIAMTVVRAPIALLLCALLVSSPTFAKPARGRQSAEAQALGHYEEGTKAYNEGDYARAVAEYKAGYKLKPEPVLLYNIAQSYRLGGDLVQATTYYKLFLKNKPNAPNRREVEERIRKLEEETRAKSPPPDPTPVASAAPSPSPSPSLLAPVPGVEVHNTRTTPDNEIVDVPPTHKPVYKKWWFWTIIGVVVVGAGVGVGLGLGLKQPTGPSSALGTTSVF